MNGEYREELPFISEGELIVTEITYKVQFYFSGPDMRYNGTFIEISRSNIDKYIDAYEKNWQKYLKLIKMKDELGSNFSTEGIMGMRINIGGYHEGVCIDYYHMPIKTEKELTNLIKSFHWAKERGPKIMEFLKSL